MKRSQSESSTPRATPGHILEIPLSLIDEPEQPDRRSMNQDSLSELAESLKSEGQLQPGLVRPSGNRYVIVAGHRRYRAAHLAQLPTFRAEVLDLTPDKARRAGIHENLHREDLTPMEQARIVHTLMHEDGLEVYHLMQLFKKGQGWIQSRIDLWHMPDYITEEIDRGKLSIGVARELMDITDEEHRRYLVGMAVNFGCSIRMAQSWRQQWASQLPMQEELKKDPASHAYTPTPGEVKMPCWFCSASTPLPLLAMVRFCPDCITNADKVRTSYQGPPAPSS